MALENFTFDPPPLETERLRLRKLTYDDAADIFAYASDPEVGRLTTWEPHASVEDSLEYLRRVMGWYERGLGGPWGMVPKEHGRVVGTCGFDITPAHASAEMGYALGRDWWNRGLMSEAVAEMIRFGFAELGLNRIEARCIPANIASARVMEKCGMTYEGTLREQVFVKGHFTDLRMYAVLRRDWEAR